MARGSRRRMNPANEQLIAEAIHDLKDVDESHIIKARRYDGATLYLIAKKYTKMHNYLKAIPWFRKAAAQNINEARRDLGDIYLNGRGVRIDYKQAMDWYIKAVAYNRDPMTQHSIAKMFYYGKGVPKDLQTAIQWFTSSANQDYTPAQTWLGQIYENDNEIRDLQKAVNWTHKAAKNGDNLVQISLKRLNEKGYYPDEQETVKTKALTKVKNEVLEEQEEGEFVDDRPQLIEILDSSDSEDEMNNVTLTKNTQQSPPLTNQNNDNIYKLMEDKLKKQEHAFKIQIEKDEKEREILRKKVDTLEKEKVRKDILMEQRLYVLEQNKVEMEMEIKQLREALTQSVSRFEENPRIDIYYN